MKLTIKWNAKKQQWEVRKNGVMMLITTDERQACDLVAELCKQPA